MAFTYTEDLTNDRDFVRFYAGDTVEATSALSDAIIASLLATQPSREAAVVAALRGLLAQLNAPDFRADWLSVDHATARAGLLARLADAERLFGLDAASVETIVTYRSDTES
jgi:hypothetical protein